MMSRLGLVSILVAASAVVLFVAFGGMAAGAPPERLQEIIKIQKVDGDFGTSSEVFTPVPGTQVTFDIGRTGGQAVFWVSSSSLRRRSTCKAAQIGVRLNGVDLPVSTNHIREVEGSVTFQVTIGGVTSADNLATGVYGAEVVARLVDPACFRAIVAATPEQPLNFVTMVIKK